MNKEQFNRYLAQPESMNDAAAEQLSELIGEFSFFQTAHLLLLKNYHKQENIKFNKQLKYSAAFIGNRKILYQLLLSGKKKFENDQEAGIKTGISSNNSDIVQISDIKFSISDEKSGNNTEILSVIPKKASDNSQKLLEIISNTDTNNEILSVDIQEPGFRKNFTDTIADTQGLTENHENIQNHQTGKGFAGEMHTFADWLNYLSVSNDVDTGKRETSHFKQAGKSDLIDNFIRSRPKIERIKIPSETPADISINSSSDKDDLITETLAKIYINQKYYERAILAYQKLSLQFPEKNIYFATQIEKIKELINKQ